eukprot:3152283-Prymnesium_polylepis.1
MECNLGRRSAMQAADADAMNRGGRDTTRSAARGSDRALVALCAVCAVLLGACLSVLQCSHGVHSGMLHASGLGCRCCDAAFARARCTVCPGCVLLACPCPLWCPSSGCRAQCAI